MPRAGAVSLVTPICHLDRLGRNQRPPIAQARRGRAFSSQAVAGNSLPSTGKGVPSYPDEVTPSFRKLSKSQACTLLCWGNGTCKGPASSIVYLYSVNRRALVS